MSQGEIMKKINWNATKIRITNISDLSDMPGELPVCNSLYASGCTGLTSLPELPVCKWLNATGCTLNAPEGTPVIKNIDAAILGCIEQGGCLDMGDWHTCETTHCRAGWAIHLACDAGRELEEKTCASIAGTLIYAASRPGVPIPDFYATNKEAMADMKRCAESILKEPI